LPPSPFSAAELLAEGSGMTDIGDQPVVTNPQDATRIGQYLNAFLVVLSRDARVRAVEESWRIGRRVAVAVNSLAEAPSADNRQKLEHALAYDVRDGVLLEALLDDLDLRRYESWLPGLLLAHWRIWVLNDAAGEQRQVLQFTPRVRPVDAVRAAGESTRDFERRVQRLRAATWPSHGRAKKVGAAH
jgi:hypothetical protein